MGSVRVIKTGSGMEGGFKTGRRGGERLDSCFENVKKMLEKRRIERELQSANGENLRVQKSGNQLETVHKPIQKTSARSYTASKETPSPRNKPFNLSDNKRPLQESITASLLLLRSKGKAWFDMVDNRNSASPSNALGNANRYSQTSVISNKKVGVPAKKPSEWQAK